MKQPLRIGLIGFGKIGRIHYQHLLEMSDAAVTIVADSCLNQTGVAPTVPNVSDWREVMNRDDVDAVIISLPHHLHRETAVTALERGKHVFLEKPLATTLADAEAVVAAAEKYKRTLMVNMTHRFYPPVRRAYELLRQGVIGEVISVRDYYMEIIDRQTFPAWFFDPVMAGGGVAMTDSIHLVDRIAWLLGEPLRFFAGASRRLEPESAVEDCAEILCASASGIPATIGSFFFSGPKSWADGLSLFGTKGVMTIKAWSHIEWNRYGGETHREEGYPPAMPESERPLVGLKAALREFLDAIVDQRVPEADGQTVLNAQQIVEAFYRFTPQDSL